MANFNINDALIKDLIHINQYTLPENDLIFIGIRGAISTTPNDQAFKKAQTLNLMDINYINPRCTILQWATKTNQLASFPASTVPHISSIKAALVHQGLGANSLFTGMYTDYRKGWHKAGTATGHEAFRQNAIRPIRRSADDLDYDKDDRIEYGNPQDNMHCGWFQSLDSASYSSAGCQVIMGYPKCSRPGREKNIGPWAVFHKNAYSIPQNSFPYLLFTGTEVFQLAAGNTPKTFKLRFGSKGLLVSALQEALKTKSYYEGNIDGDFGERTMRALVNFQLKVFGKDGADGIAGPLTAEELKINLKYKKI
ncbi:peptidoglycan-binding domain-containing protein [Pedobacter sp.]|uniref:peptidoglycan-binding domain-containing protein n=1 Tax=Pedobacter sp. TaxID=1411316 RepID=UPI00396C8416